MRNKIHFLPTYAFTGCPINCSPIFSSHPWDDLIWWQLQEENTKSEAWAWPCNEVFFFFLWLNGAASLSFLMVFGKAQMFLFRELGFFTEATHCLTLSENPVVVWGTVENQFENQFTATLGWYSWLEVFPDKWWWA